MAAEQAISEQDLIDALANSAAVFSERQVRYAIIGGMATGFRSQPRFTKDVDILLQVAQIALPALLADLGRRGFDFDELAVIREWTQHHMATISYHGIRVDLLKPVLPAYLHILDRATTETWLDHPIRVASAEGLILLKLLAFRTQDVLDIENLVAVTGKSLDLDWIRGEWQTIEPLDDPRMKRLEELVAKCNIH
jgi:hypothetical protein